MNNMMLAHCTGSTLANATTYAQAMTECMAHWKINTPDRQAAFLANVAIETANLSAVEESLYYTTPDRLREIFPSLFVLAKGGRYKAEDYTRNSAKLSALRYKGFHGRGMLHLTWEANYKLAGDAIGFDYVSNPKLVMVPWHACATACWFFAEYKGLNQLADRVDLFAVRQAINGPAALKLVEVKRQRLTALVALRDNAIG